VPGADIISTIGSTGGPFGVASRSQSDVTDNNTLLEDLVVSPFSLIEGPDDNGNFVCKGKTVIFSECSDGYKTLGGTFTGKIANSASPNKLHKVETDVNGNIVKIDGLQASLDGTKTAWLSQAVNKDYPELTHQYLNITDVLTGEVTPRQ